MHLPMSTVTGIIDRLEAARLAARSRSAGNARILELRLTAKGRAILAKAPEPARSKVARRLQRLSLAELRPVRSALRLIAGAMGVDLAEPGDIPRSFSNSHLDPPSAGTWRGNRTWRM